MYIVDNAVIKDHYEVIVVGAGIGGITTAALLAKRGLDVLLIDQHYMPGGCCAAIRRQDVTMDVGATVLYGFGEKGLNTHRFVMNELEEEIDMTPRESIYNMHVEGKQITFWLEYERFFNELVTLFPNQKEELQKFYDHLFKFYKVVLKIKSISTPSSLSPADNFKMLMKSPFGMVKMSALMFQSATTLFEKFFTDPELIAFFDMLTRTFSYVDSAECPAILSATMFTDNHVGGAYYPAGSPQMLSNKLENSVEKFGGRILYRQMVDEILVENGTAHGVRLADGLEIKADRVVYNGSIWNLYGKMVKPEQIKPERMKWAQGFEPCHSNFILNIILDAKGVPENTHPMEIYIDDMHNVSAHGITVYLPTLQDPGVSPPDVCSVTITEVTDEKWPRPWEPEYRTEEYTKRKEEAADRILGRVEKHIPDFKKHIKHMEIATPSTMERYTLKNWGNVGGPKQMLGQQMIKRHGARSDWKNLYMCGDSTEIALGVLPSTISAVGAANVILRDMKKKEYKNRKFPREYVNIVKGKPWTSSPDPAEAINETSAMRIAKDCQHCINAPCMEACPAGIDLVGFFRRIESGNFAGAARSIREMNPLTEICGYICPAEKLCEMSCYRHEFADRPVRIREMHKWICENVPESDGWERHVAKSNGKKAAIVGAGPAGLSCAHYLARLGYSVNILDKAGKPGGLMTHVIPEFRLPGDVVKKEIAAIGSPGINYQFGKTLGADINVADLEKEYDAVFLAPGLWSGRKLELPGIEKANVIDALSLLLASREKKAEIGKKVLVIGGGSVAADAAVAAKDAGADEVKLVCLEDAEEMPCLKSELDELKNRGIAIENCWGPKEIIDGSTISFMGCKAVFNSDGQFSPVFDKTKTTDLSFDQIILAVGQTAEPELAAYLEKEFGSKGLIEVDQETMQIKQRPGVFAGGDIVRGAGTIIEAVGDGRRAAMGIEKILNGE